MVILMLNGSADVNNDNREKEKGKKTQQKYFESNVSREKKTAFVHPVDGE